MLWRTGEERREGKEGNQHKTSRMSAFGSQLAERLGRRWKHKSLKPTRSVPSTRMSEATSLESENEERRRNRSRRAQFAFMTRILDSSTNARGGLHRNLRPSKYRANQRGLLQPRGPTTSHLLWRAL